MRIYTRVVFRIKSGEVIESDSYEYNGPIAHCGGGSKSTINSYDPEYNRRMADIAERQQEMAEEYFKFWQDEYKPLEEEQIAANRRMLPHIEQATITQAEMVGERANVAREAYELANRGLDVGRDVDMARADVASSFADSMGIMRRDMERMGGSVGDAGWASAMAGLSRDRAKATAGAMTTTRMQSQDRDFTRKMEGAKAFDQLTR
jgi:hypothetical protein